VLQFNETSWSEKLKDNIFSVPDLNEEMPRSDKTAEINIMNFLIRDLLNPDCIGKLKE
jgi:hypothetical protein